MKEKNETSKQEKIKCLYDELMLKITKLVEEANAELEGKDKKV